MEIRDPIHGTLDLSDAEVALLDSRAYQRLRAIKQLGFSEFSFPGATHNRFLHSIGVEHLAGLAFDSVFRNYKFSKAEVRERLRIALRLAALLHDIGHGPLSHTTEEVMPTLHELHVPVYEKCPDRQANHEDYTIKFLTDSSLTETLLKNFPMLTPQHVACLVDKTLECPDDFFRDQGLDFRTILSQIVSSELDVDRMDYLERDAYFCGTNYGKVELNWLLTNLTWHRVEQNVHLALNRRALYTFDDFLLARHHMHLMVYFHHKAIIYEELLHRYLTSNDCSFFLPANIEDYIKCTDYALYEHLSSVHNPWARRIADRKPYRMLFELHSNSRTDRPEKMKKTLEAEDVPVIHSSSQARLSKYHTASETERALTIFVVDEYDRQSQPFPLQEGTQIFAKYEEIRQIDRLYVPPEKFGAAEKIIIDRKL
ncbi:MAG: HD domain-containing protein [Bdellovibrionales bacterium]